MSAEQEERHGKVAGWNVVQSIAEREQSYLQDTQERQSDISGSMYADKTLLKSFNPHYQLFLIALSSTFKAFNTHYKLVLKALISEILITQFNLILKH